MSRALTLLCLLIAVPALAAVDDVTPGGFLVHHRVTVHAAPARAWDALVTPGRWWNPEHTWSGDAKNLSMDVRPGGCFCEKLANGGMQHLAVVYAAKPEVLRLAGALGPLQGSGVAGAMTFTLKAHGDSTVVDLTYSVGGYMQGGLDKIASPADGMLGEQVGRYKRLIDTGSSTPK
jgi:uncharacterized protein YndB with AHSA1/START domain